MPKNSASPTGVPCGWPAMKNSVPWPGMNCIAKLSPTASLLRPEKISISRLAEVVCFSTSSFGEFADRPLMKARPRSVPDSSRKAVELSSFGPGSACSSSGVRTLRGVYSAMS